ncbi:MAG: hypothetical protein WC834_08125 [Eubacteriales bacterium]
MRKIDFNDNFTGFEEGEDILLDTGIILALLNQYDAWHSTVKDLFNSFIFVETSKVTLYVHSGIINEVTFLSGRPLQTYMEKYGQSYSQQDIDDAINNTLRGISELIENEILLPLDSSKASILNQIRYSRYFGAMDALVVSVVEDYGISFLTVDNRLVEKIVNKDSLANIRNLYYTLPNYRDY